MTRSRQTNRDSSRQPSSDSDEEEEEKSPIRGRSGKVDKEVVEQLMTERSKSSNV